MVGTYFVEARAGVDVGVRHPFRGSAAVERIGPASTRPLSPFCGGEVANASSAVWPSATRPRFTFDRSGRAGAMQGRMLLVLLAGGRSFVSRPARSLSRKRPPAFAAYFRIDNFSRFVRVDFAPTRLRRRTARCIGGARAGFGRKARLAAETNVALAVFANRIV